jgi:hypothetical protein
MDFDGVVVDGPVPAAAADPLFDDVGIGQIEHEGDRVN